MNDFVTHGTLPPALEAPASRALFDLHPHGVLVVDAQGRVVAANPAAAWLVDAGRALPALSDLADLSDATGAACRRALSDGTDWQGPVTIGPPGGERRAVHLRVAGASPAESIRLCFVQPLATTPPGADDVPALADRVPVLMWTSDATGHATWFNTPWRAFTGQSLAALQGDGWLEGVHPEDAERCVGIYRTSFEERQPFTMDFRLRRHDGAYRWVLHAGIPRQDAQGRFEGYIGSAVDIHERKQLEESLAAHAQTLRLSDRRQNEFLAMLSHQLRSPLAPIANAASVLRTLEDQQPTLARLREIIERQVGRLRRLVDDLVDVTRVMQGQITLVKGRVSVRDLLRSATETSQPKLDAAGHTLRIDAPAASLWVAGDPVRLAQALSNILANAAAFTPEPSVISVTARAAGDTLSIAVRDEGQGITSEFLPFVFDLFSRHDLQSGGNPGGLGLGLPLARRIVQLHGGDVKAFSEGPGQGAEFVLSLPLATDDAGQPDDDHGAPAAPTYRVLLIEGNPDSRYLMRLQIELWGHQVATADSVEESLRVLEAFRPEVVIGDIEHSDATDTIGFAGLRDHVAPSTVFVALTGYGHHEDDARARAAGFDAVLVKPLRPDSLSRLVEPLLASHATPAGG